MNAHLNLVAAGIAGILSVGVLNSRADLEVGASFSIHAHADFYSPLAVHGAWIDVGNYGRCWRPASVAIEWRPYCYGHWVWTDCGWYWESDEPWAWACYHYGNWVYDPTYAWIWIPGVEWGPAWVEWRVGGGYIGWAPLLPARVTIALGAPHFVFVQTARFQDRLQPAKVIVNNNTIINNTTVINNITRETRTIAGAGTQRVVVNNGPGVDGVQKATGKKLTAVPVHEVAGKTAVPAEVKAKGREASKGNAQTSPAPAVPPKPAPKLTSPPVENREQPGKAAPPNVEKNRQQKTERPFLAPPAESPKPAPEQGQRPSEKPERGKPVAPPPAQDKRPPDGYKPLPGGAPPPNQPPAKPSHPDGQKDNGKGNDKNREPKAGGKDE